MSNNELFALMIIVLGGVLLTFARRFNNKDSDAGSGIAAWTFITVIVWLLAVSS